MSNVCPLFEILFNFYSLLFNFFSEQILMCKDLEILQLPSETT